MSGNPAHLLTALRRRAAPDGPAADAGLLRRYARTADPEAFAELVRRHGPVVLGVCRRVLGNAADADDAFQAVFLVLARKAGAVSGQSAGSWLYGVARRVSVRLRDKQRRRARHERAAVRSEVVAADPDRAELLRVLDEELARLPAAERAAVLACHVRGLTQEQAAAELGLSLSTIRRRLDRGRELLRERLARRLGVGAAALTANGLAEPVSAGLVEATQAAAVAFAAGVRVGTPSSILAHEALAMMTRVKLATAAGLVALVAGLGVGAGAVRPAANADDPNPAAKAEKPPPAATKPPAGPPKTGELVARADPNDLIRPGERLRISGFSAADQAGNSVDLGIGEVRVEPSGKVPLGLNYGGRVKLSGLTVEEAEDALAAHLREVVKFREPRVEVIRLDWAVTAAPAGVKPAADAIRPGDRLAIESGSMAGATPVRGVYRVDAAGKVPVGVHGRVEVGGLTVEEAEDAIRKKLAFLPGGGNEVLVTRPDPAPDRDEVEPAADGGKLKDRVRRLEREVADLKKAVEELRRK